LTAVSAICLLGLAIWFSKTEPLVASATSCYCFLTSQLHPIQPRGRTLYFEALFLSSGRCRFIFSASPRSESTSRRGASFLLSRGRGTYFASASLSTDLADSLLPAEPTLSPLRLRRFEGGGFYHRRVGSQHRSLTAYFVFQSRPGAPVAVATSLSRSEGRGFYHHRVRSQPPSLTLSSSHSLSSGACSAVAPARRAKGTDT
jgi:hypothetical protein